MHIITATITAATDRQNHHPGLMETFRMIMVNFPFLSQLSDRAEFGLIGN
jgi:hypothetical protein